MEFTISGTEYGYWIQAPNGNVVRKKVELIGASGSRAGIIAVITQKGARKVALRDAEFTEVEITISTERLGTKSGVVIYEVNLTKGSMECEHDVDTTTGVVCSKNSESTAFLSTEAAAQPSETQTAAADTTVVSMVGGRSNNSCIGLERAEMIALSDAGLSAVPVTFAETKQDLDDGMPNYDLDFYTAIHEYDYKISAQTGAIVGKSVEMNERTVRGTKPTATVAPIAAPTAVAAETSKGLIGVDRAKSIALGYADVSTFSVPFSKAKLDDNDGRDVYKIEFYAGNTEYNCKVDAYSGGIIEYDIDHGWSLQTSRFGK